MKRVISVLLCIAVLSGSLFVTTAISGDSGYNSAVQLLTEEYGISNSQLIYNNSLDDAVNPPLTNFYNTTHYNQGNSIIENGRWHISMAGGKAVAFSDTLVGRDIANFAYSFEFESIGTWSNAYFIFHSLDNNTPDWHTDYGSYIRIRHNPGNNAEYPVLSVAGQKTSNTEFLMSRNKTYNILLVARGGQYDLYIWEKGKNVGEPVISVEVSGDNTGDFTFNSYQANCYVDNIKIYDLSLLGQNISGSKLLYDNDFNRADATVPMGIAGSIQNSALNISGNNIASSSGMTGLSTLGEFQFMTEYKTTLPEGMNEQWNFAGGALSLGLCADKVILNTTNEAAFAFASDKTYNLAVRYKGEKVKVFVWEKGTLAPVTALIEQNVGALNGDIGYSADVADSVYDNIKVYDLTKVEDDTTLKQLADWNFDDASAEIPIKAENGLSYDNETLRINANGAKLSTDGFFGASVSDMFWQFDYIPAVVEGNTDSFIFHKDDENGTALALAFIGDDIANGGNNIEIRSITDGTVKTLASATEEPFVSGQLYTARIMFIGDMAYFKFWKKNAGTPAAYTLSAAVDTAAFYSGDFAIQSDKGNFAVDRMTIYRNIPDLTQYDEQEVEEVVKLLDYNFDDPTAAIPFKMGNDPTLSTLSYTGDGRLHIQTNWSGRAVCSDPLGGKDLKNFVWQFDYQTTEFAWNNDFFTFHSQDADDFNCLGLRIKGGKFCGGGDNVLIEKKVDNVATTLASTRIEGINDGLAFKIRISMQNGDIKVWIWPSDEATPEECTLQAANDTDFLNQGKTYIYGYQTFFYLDDMVLYSGNPDRALLDTLSAADRQEKLLLLDTDFSNESDLICEANGEPASVKVEDGKLKVASGTQNMLYATPILDGVEAYNISWQFEYTPHATRWNTDRFVFHSDGRNEGHALCLEILGTGPAEKTGTNFNLVRRYSGNERDILASTNIALEKDVTYTVRIICKDETIYAYVWSDGSNTPTEPTLTATCEDKVVKKGKFILQGYESNYSLDNMRLYNYHDGYQESDVSQPFIPQEKQMLIDADFSDESDLICNANKEPASVKVEDGKLKVASGAQNMLYGTPILDGVQSGDISWQFEYTPHATQWNTDRFVFHSDGKNEGHALCLEILGTGPAKKAGTNFNIVRRYSANERDVLASTDIALVKDVTYTVRIICKDETVYVYVWNSGSNTPTEPTLTATCEDVAVQSGKFMLQGYESNYSLDNMRLYNYHDGYQTSTVLNPLPSNVRLIDWNFNGMRGKTEFPMTMKNSLIYWQNTLKIKTPKGIAVDGKNLIGDHTLGDLCWEFQVRDFEAWSVNQFVIHSQNGGLDNCIYLLYCGEKTATLKNPTGHAEDPDCSSLRLIQVVNGNGTLIGKANVELKRGKAYNVKITSRNNRIEVAIGAKRTGTMSNVISAQASDAVSEGMTFIKGYQTHMWLDNMILSNAAERSNTTYEGSLYAVTK